MQTSNAKKIVIVLGTVVVIFGFATLTSLRQTQICSFKPFVEENIFTSTQEICLNAWNPLHWFTISANTFSFNIGQTISISENYNPDKPVQIIDSSDLKSTNGITNFLIAGTDGRTSSENSSNTDSILVVRFEQRTGKFIIVSFPRDLLIFHKNIYGDNEYIKINSIYRFYPADPIQALNNSLEQILGEPIHYYAYVNFSTFTQIIQDLGGIDISLEEEFTDAFPRDELEEMGQECVAAEFDSNFCIVTFPAGEQRFTPDDALIFARARYLSSDFVRAERQQELIKAAINQVLNSGLNLFQQLDLSLRIFNTVNSNIATNVSIEDIEGLFAFYEKITGEFVTVIADPAISNGELIYEAGQEEGFGYVLRFYDYSYANFQDYLDFTWNFHPFIQNQPSILFINTNPFPLADGTQTREVIDTLSQITNVNVIRDTTIDTEATRIYNFSGEDFNDVTTELLKLIPNAFLFDSELDGIEQSSLGEDIIVLVK